MAILSSKALKRIVKEMTTLQQQPPEDIQVIANEENLTEIQAWIRGPDGTPYEEGYFKIRLVLDDNFPDTPPKGYFITKIFHPNVSHVGEICVNTLKKDWKSELGIEHVLLTIKCLLIVPNPESALNEEAGKLLLEQYDDYAKRARLYTSIQAKSGKNEFITLLKQRLPNNEENKKVTTLEEKSNATSSSSVTTAPAAAAAAAAAVLKPLSNTSPTTTITSPPKKRALEEEENSTLLDQEQQFQQTEDTGTKKSKKNNGKKKSLRRL